MSSAMDSEARKGNYFIRSCSALIGSISGVESPFSKVLDMERVTMYP